MIGNCNRSEEPDADEDVDNDVDDRRMYRHSDGYRFTSVTSSSMAIFAILFVLPSLLTRNEASSAQSSSSASKSKTASISHGETKFHSSLSFQCMRSLRSTILFLSSCNLLNSLLNEFIFEHAVVQRVLYLFEGKPAE